MKTTNNNGGVGIEQSFEINTSNKEVLTNAK